MKYLALLLIFPYLAKAITIQQAEVVGDGSDEDSPLVEGTANLNHYFNFHVCLFVRALVLFKLRCRDVSSHY